LLEYRRLRGAGEPASTSLYAFRGCTSCCCFDGCRQALTLCGANCVFLRLTLCRVSSDLLLVRLLLGLLRLLPLHLGSKDRPCSGEGDRLNRPEDEDYAVPVCVGTIANSPDH
jgi:hypothetical protein